MPASLDETLYLAAHADASALDALEAEELARRGGPRPKALRAIAERRAELAG